MPFTQMRFTHSITEWFRNQQYESIPAISKEGDVEQNEYSDKDEQRIEPSSLPTLIVQKQRPSIWWLIITTLLSANLIAIIVFTMKLTRFTCGNVPVVQPHSDAVFGDIPVKQTMWRPDESFTSADPWDGAYWNNNTGSKGTTAWDELFRSAWVSVENPRSYGLSGGVPLRHFAPLNFKDVWSESAEGYVPTVIHQLHCVGIMKHLVEVQKSSAEVSEHEDYGSLNALLKHGEHCIEYFRHSFMCAADLTLEPPETVDMAKLKIHGTEGWGASHSCRDWAIVHDRIWERLIKFVNFGDHGMRILPDGA